MASSTRRPPNRNRSNTVFVQGGHHDLHANRHASLSTLRIRRNDAMDAYHELRDTKKAGHGKLEEAFVRMECLESVLIGQKIMAAYPPHP
jgi:hypothetical protein